MDLTLHEPIGYLSVRAVSAEGVQVGEVWYRDALILTAQHLDPAWDIKCFTQLDKSRLQPVFALSPDVVLLGTGAQQHFLPTELMMLFYDKGIGVEAMATPTACRTFNVLASEGRRVVAALLPPGA